MTKKPFLQIALACLLAGLVSSISILRIDHKYLFLWIPFSLLVKIVMLYFLCTLAYIFTGLKKGAQILGKSPSLLAFWQGALRYFIAFDLCVFGIGKLFHMQFNTPLAKLDDPFSSFQSDDLMWAFFGVRYAFAVVTGGMQVIGSLLLLYRRTRLFAVIFLMPLMLTILLMDYLYNNGTGVEIYVTIEVTALFYLLLAEYRRLADFFFIAKSNLPQFHFKSALWKNAIRFSIIYIPLLIMLVQHFPQFYPGINGKYEVKNMIINNAPQNLNPCRDSVLTKVFIDKEDFVLEFNNYMRRFIGSYKYNPATRDITAIWRYPENQHDTLFAKILPGNAPNIKLLTGRMGKEIFKINMLRVNNGE